jgi:hypothetical protein
MPITAYITTVALPSGSGRPRSKPKPVKEIVRPLKLDPFNTGHSPSPKSYIPIENDDNLCLFYALEIGRLQHDRQIIKKMKGKVPKHLLSNYK